MAQFLLGFWCGFVSAVVIVCLLYKSKKQKAEDSYNREYGGNNVADGDGRQTAPVGSKVLIVDDSKLSRTLIKELLGNGTYVFSEAENGEECLKLIKKNQFDLIFLDQNMPGLSGDETLRRLRKEGGVYETVPVIAVSSSVRKENEKEFQQKGYVTCLGKPFQKTRLAEILSPVFEERKTEPVSAKEMCPEGFSYGNGLANFDGNEEVYRETLVLFAELWKERKEQLEQFLADENMQEYAILIHAIKGDARTLGANGLGELAYGQELSAKAGDTKAVRAGFEQVMTLGEETAQYFIQKYS